MDLGCKSGLPRTKGKRLEPVERHYHAQLGLSKSSDPECSVPQVDPSLTQWAGNDPALTAEWNEALKVHEPGLDYQKDAVHFAMEAQKWQSKAERYEIEVMALREILRGMTLSYDVLREVMMEEHTFEWTDLVDDNITKIMSEYREDAEKILSGGLKDEETPKE